jgi:hypothetical protein
MTLATGAHCLMAPIWLHSPPQAVSSTKPLAGISISGTGLCMLPKASYPVVVAGLPKSQNDLTSLTGRLWRRGKDEPEAL